MITTNFDARIYNEMQNYRLNSDEKLVFLTILLSPERSLVGIHRVDPDILKVRTGLTKGKIRAALQKLHEEKLIIGELEGGEFYTPYFLKSNPLKGGKTYKIYLEDLQRVRNRNLVEILIADLNYNVPVTFAAALEDAGYEEILESLNSNYDFEELRKARNGYVKEKKEA